MYKLEDVKKWAGEYEKVKSFNKVANKFGINPKTVNKWLKHYKKELDLELTFETYNNLLKDNKKKCNECGLIKDLTEFEKVNNIYRHICKECRRNKNTEYRAVNKDKINQNAREFRVNNRDMLSLKAKEKYANKRLIILEKQKDSYYSNWKHNRLIKNNYYRRRMNDCLYRLTRALRSRLKVLDKHIKAPELLGCSTDELKLYLESKFYSNPKTGEEMSWNNYGFYGWHVDHIVPLATIKDINDKEQIKKVCHYTNLQPLWAEENFRKGSRI